MTAGLLIPIAITLGGLTLGYALVAVQVFGIATIINAFSPNFNLADGGRLLAENLTVFSSATAVRGIPFGRSGIAGQILYRENISNTGDTPDELLLILGLAGYPATALEKFWFNEELVFDGDSTTGPGAITTGKFANDLWVWFRTGAEDTDAFPEIATLSSTWNAKTRKLRGIPSIGIRIKITEAVDGKLQPLAQIKGGKWYDPRLDSTVPGGSGAHRINDDATWEFTVNPKLAELAYLIGGSVNGTKIFGMFKPAAAIDLENFASEANVCEEQIDVVGGGTIDRYTLNGLLVPTGVHKENLQRLLSASAGTMDASGGIYRTFAGAWRAPSMTLTEADIDGAPTDIQLQIDQSKEINVIGGVYAEPNEMWNVKEYPERTNATSIALFGENVQKLDLPFTTDHRIAQRISKIHMLRVNARRAFNANYWMRAVSLQPGDIVTQTYSRYGITSETFRVDFWSLEARDDRFGSRLLVVPMRMVEELEVWFDWDETSEEITINAGGALPSIPGGRLTEVYYIKPINGTAIRDGTGTLTVEAHRIFAGVDALLSTGTIQLFVGSTLITVANGFAAGSDGYTGVLDAGDITGFATVELKDGASGVVLDTITLVDIIDGFDGDDGLDAVLGFIEPENGLAWSREGLDGAWSPSQLTTDLDVTFVQGGAEVARRGYRLTLNEPAGTITGAVTPHPLDNLNTSRITITPVGTGTPTFTVKFDYSFGGDEASVSETVHAVQGGATGLPGDVKSLTYDDLDLAILAAGQSRYAMLTDRATDTSGSQNNFHLTDAILINRKDLPGVNLSLFFAGIKAGARVTYRISATRWFSFLIDETFAVIGSGATEAYKFGVSLFDSVDPDPTVNVPTAAGTEVEFQFNTSRVETGNLLLDPDFDFSSALGANFLTEKPWFSFFEIKGSGFPAGGGITFQAGSGANGSNSIKFDKGTIDFDAGGWSSDGRVTTSDRIRTNTPAFDFKVRYRNNGANTFTRFRVQVLGYATPTGGSVVTSAQLEVDLVVTGTTWTELSGHIEADQVDTAQYWSFRFGYFDTQPDTAEEVEVDSIFIFATPTTFGTSIIVPGGGGNSKVQPGMVPEADASTDAAKVLAGNGSWVTNGSGGGATELDALTDVTITSPGSNHILKHNGTLWVNGIMVSDDIAAGIVTLTKMANIATARFIGRTTAGTGVPQALTIAQATAMMNVFTNALKGVAPASGGGTDNFLRADGNWEVPPGGGGGSGTVTAVSAGNGMDFSTINVSGGVILGTPGDVTGVSTNSVSATSHTHASGVGIPQMTIITGIENTFLMVARNSVSNVFYVRQTGSGDICRFFKGNDNTSSSSTQVTVTNAGGLTVTGDITAFFSSDARLKHTITPIYNALDRICKLTGRSFYYNDPNKAFDDRLQYGFIAQEMQQVLPEIVYEKADGKLPGELAIKQAGYEIQAMLVEAMKELRQEVIDLRQQVQNLRADKS